MSLLEIQRPDSKRLALLLVFPAAFLGLAYGLLGLTFVEHRGNLMTRCVLMDPNLSRIWSVAHIEIGAAYMGVFIGMTYYLLKASKVDHTHTTDLLLALVYLLLSFALDYACVRYFSPFEALLIGDAVVMTFTLLVSKQLWFQRLLGIFVPLVFFTCSLGHFMEGMSYWRLTYPVNVPWTMVTADIGFAILVNTARFPAFIRGHELESEVELVRAAARAQAQFLKDVLLSVSEGRLRLAETESDLPAKLPVALPMFELSAERLADFRHEVSRIWNESDFPADREFDMLISVGEAAMNAVVHGHGGYAEVRSSADSFQVWVRDRGPGIRLEQIPRATLEKGYSTTGTLGHGFWLILQTADTLDIVTGSDGTTVVLTYDRIRVHLSGHHYY